MGTGAGLLLDVACVHCTAYTLGIDPYAYALALPLNRVREIHVSRPYLYEGVLRDWHTEMQEGYALLAWVLKRTEPQIVTLEYGVITCSRLTFDASRLTLHV